MDIWRYIPNRLLEAVEDVSYGIDKYDTKYWIYLNKGWTAYDGGDDCGVILENTVKGLRAAIKTIRRKKGGK